jgi:hypothetical protein
MSRLASSALAGFGHGGSVLIRRLLTVAFFLEVGLLLIVLPWSTFWDRNYFASVSPLLRRLVTNDFIRGGISGLGVVNLFAGFSELSLLFAARERDGIARQDPAETPTFPAGPDTQADH